MFEAIENKAKSAARNVALSAAGALALMVGLAFLTAAAWIYLCAVADPLTAAMVIGGVYAGPGLILLGLTSARRAPAQRRPEAQTPQAPTAPPVMQAFLHGMQAGANAQRG